MTMATMPTHGRSSAISICQLTLRMYRRGTGVIIHLFGLHGHHYSGIRIIMVIITRTITTTAVITTEHTVSAILMLTTIMAREDHLQRL